MKPASDAGSTFLATTARFTGQLAVGHPSHSLPSLPHRYELLKNSARAVVERHLGVHRVSLVCWGAGQWPPLVASMPWLLPLLPLPPLIQAVLDSLNQGLLILPNLRAHCPAAPACHSHCTAAAPAAQADVHHHHHRSRLPPIHVRLCGGETDVTIR